MSVLIRWSVWGQQSPIYYDMLAHSIATFRHFFGAEVRYVVFTDTPSAASRHLGRLAEVNDFRTFLPPSKRELFAEHGTWRKWAPQIRLFNEHTELRVDADMFLLSSPHELYDFCFHNQGRWDYAVTLEEHEELWPYGNFAPFCQGIPHINAGLVGQSLGADLSTALRERFIWWRDTLEPPQRLYHDEQGAVMAALIPSLQRNKTLCLAPSRYRVVCPLNADATSSIEDVVLLHATYPEHPAFLWFQDIIRKVAADVLAQHSL